MFISCFYGAYTSFSEPFLIVFPMFIFWGKFLELYYPVDNQGYQFLLPYPSILTYCFALIVLWMHQDSIVHNMWSSPQQQMGELYTLTVVQIAKKSIHGI